MTKRAIGSSKLDRAKRKMRKGAKHNKPIPLHIVIPLSKQPDFIDFAKSLTVPAESTIFTPNQPLFSESEMREIRKLFKVYSEEESTLQKGLDVEVENAAKFSSKYKLAQYMFAATFVEKNGKRLFSDEELPDLFHKMLTGKRIRNSFTLDRWDEIHNLACDMFYDDPQYLERMKQHKAEQAEQQSQKDNKQESIEGSKTFKKLQKKFDTLNAKIEQERRQFKATLQQQEDSFNQKEEKLLAQIAQLNATIAELEGDKISAHNERVDFNKRISEKSSEVESLRKQLKEAPQTKINIFDHEEYKKLNETYKDVSSKNLTLQAQVSELEAKIKQMETSPQMMFYDAIVSDVAKRINIEATDDIANFNMKISQLEAIVKGHQSFISRVSAPQTAKQEISDNATNKMDVLKQSLLDKGFSESDIQILQSFRVAFFGNESLDRGEYSSFWQMLNSQSEFFSVNEYDGSDISQIIESGKFDFVLLSRNRSHSKHSSQISSFDNPRLIDYANYSVNNRYDAARIMLDRS